MGLYVVRKETATRRGVEVERIAIESESGEHVMGLDLPANLTTDWFRMAGIRVRANLKNRHDEDAPVFGAAHGDAAALAFAEMFNA